MHFVAPCVYVCVCMCVCVCVCVSTTQHTTLREQPLCLSCSSAVGLSLSSCASNAALTGHRAVAAACCTSIANTACLPISARCACYCSSATKRVPVFHTRFDHARSGLIHSQPMATCPSAFHACRFNPLETRTSLTAT